MVGRGEDLVEVLFFEQGFLGLETILVKKRIKNRIACDGLFRKAQVITFLEIQQVGIEESETNPMTGEAPVAFACDGFFKL